MKKQKYYPWLVALIGILIMSGTWGLFINCIGVLFNAVKADCGFKDSEMALYYSIRSIVGSFTIGLTMKLFSGKKGNLWLAAYCGIFAVSVGMMALRIVVPLEMTGSHPSRMLRKYISSIATKKFGRELPMKLQKRIR